MLFFLHTNLSPQLVTYQAESFPLPMTLTLLKPSSLNKIRLLQVNLRNIASSPCSVGLALNESKWKAQRRARKLSPIIATYKLNDHALGISFAVKSPIHF